MRGARSLLLSPGLLNTEVLLHLRRKSQRSGSNWQFDSSDGVSRFTENLLASLLLTRSMRRRSYGVGRFCFEGTEKGVSKGVKWESCSLVLQNFVVLCSWSELIF